MDLLQCPSCESRFYVPGDGAPPGQHCSRCGAGLVLSRHHVSSIPLDARCLGEPRMSALGSRDPLGSEALA
jgi:hypothetical protein